MRLLPAILLLVLCGAAARAAAGAEQPPAPPPEPVAAVPGYARYITVQGARPGTVSQILFAVDGADFAVTGVDSPYPFLAASWREAAEAEREPGVAGRQWVVAMTIGPDAPVGPLGALLAVRVTHPKQERVQIPVSGFVRPRFAVTPPEARFGALAAGATVTERFHVRNFMEEAVELGAPEVDVPGVVARIAPAEAGRSWWLTLTLGPGLPAGAFSGRVTVRAAAAGVPPVELPLAGTVRAP